MKKIFFALLILTAAASYAQPISSMPTYNGSLDSFYIPGVYRVGSIWLNRKIPVLNSFVLPGGSYNNPAWITGIDAAKIIQSANFRLVSDVEKGIWNNKQNAITLGATSQYFRGDLSFGVFANDVQDVGDARYGRLSTNNTFTGISTFNSQVNAYGYAWKTVGGATLGIIGATTNGGFNYGNFLLKNTENAFQGNFATAVLGADRNYLFPNASGTVALQEWIIAQGYSNTPYILPAATVSALGGVIVGNGLTITGGGVLSGTSYLRINTGGINYQAPRLNLIAGNGISLAVSQATGDNDITINSTGAGGGMTNPMTTLGDIIYGAATGTPTRFAGNLTATKKYLTQTGDGTNSAAPVWDVLPIVNFDNTKFAGDGSSGAPITLLQSYALASHTHNASDITAGTLPISRGGRGSSTIGTVGQSERVAAGGTTLEWYTPGGGALTQNQIGVGNASGVLGGDNSFKYNSSTVEQSITPATGLKAGLIFANFSSIGSLGGGGGFVMGTGMKPAAGNQVEKISGIGESISFYTVRYDRGITISTGIGNADATGTLYADDLNKRWQIDNNGNVFMYSLPVYANEAAAVTGGLAQNALYKTSTGEIRIKL